MAIAIAIAISGVGVAIIVSVCMISTNFWILFFALMFGALLTSLKAFKPQSKDELKTAINQCIKMFKGFGIQPTIKPRGPLHPILPKRRRNRVLFENHRLRMTDVRLRPGSALSTVHEFPTVRWQVGPGLERSGDSRLLNLSSTRKVNDKRVQWFEAGSSFAVINSDTAEWRQITWEIKQTPRHTEKEVQELMSNAIYSTDVGTSLLFENRYCRVWDFYLEPGQDGGTHHHVLDYAFVYVADGRLLGSYADGRPGLFDSVNKDGDVTWEEIPANAGSNPDYAHGGKNGYDDRPMREYLVELK